jgi:glycosyltransferase involved in cell wall biosynthesis
MKLSVVVPAHNEQDNIKEVIDRIERSLDIEHELIIVNDHSTDATAEIVDKLSRKYNNLRLVENKLKQGFANAIKTGLGNVTTELSIPVMGDLCDDLLTIKKMLQKINEGYDIVCGCRYIKGGARLGGSRLKGFFSYFVGWSLCYLLGFPTRDIANAFKMYRKTVIENIDIKSKGFEVSMEIPLKAYYLGFKITEVPTVWRERTKGKSSFRMMKLFPSYLKLYIWAIFKSFTK